MAEVLRGRALAPGEARGTLLVLEEPLSLWGGMDPATGEVIDPHHPQAGRSLAGAVVALPGGRGSSSSSSVLAEAVRAGTAPAALVLSRPDAIVLVGAVVAEELYGSRCPVVVLPPDGYARLRSGAEAAVIAGDDRAEVRLAAGP